MDLEKRKMMINEIEKWRHSKLLPEQYCNFLLNLYMDDATERPKHVLGLNTQSILNSHPKLWFLSFGLISLICFVVLHFNSFPLPLQISIAAIFIVLLFIIGVRYQEKQKAIAFTALGSGCITLLLFGIHFLTGADLTEPRWIVAYLGLCSIIWLLMGLTLRISLLHLCGWLGLLLCYSWVIHQFGDTQTWVLTEMYWLPASLLFSWFAWVTHYKNKSISGVLLLVAGLLWFLPEVYQLVLGSLDGNQIQIAMIIKIVMIGTVLFTYRKKWIEWVA